MCLTLACSQRAASQAAEAPAPDAPSKPPAALSAPSAPAAAAPPEAPPEPPPQAAPTSSSNVRIATDPRGAHVLMDGALIGVSPLTVRLPVGSHRMRVMSAGYHSQELDFRVTDAQPLTKLFVALRLDRPAPTPSTESDDAEAATQSETKVDPRQQMLRHLGTASVAAGVLVLGGALVLEVMRSQAAAAAREEPEQIRFAEALDRTQTRQTWARILAGSGGTLTALGVTLLVLSRGSSRAAEPQVALTCVPGECSARLRGAF